ncbi:hypothetical protein ACIRRI_27850 [Streptomyces mirabilis]|uniref:hypothetical protein n=1 Tax=Streptomyces mirabilis TaxID=68239 RepID=UPI00380F0C93
MDSLNADRLNNAHVEEIANAIHGNTAALLRVADIIARENRQIAVGRRLLQDHPDLPLTGFAISRSICPEPGRPLHRGPPSHHFMRVKWAAVLRRAGDIAWPSP